MNTGIKAVCRISATLVTAGSVMVTGALVAPAAQAAPTAAPKAPSIVAKGGFLMDAASGRTYFGKYADTRLSTGSTTKIMTAQVVLATKGVNLNTKVTIDKAYSDYIVAKGASSARLIVGDKVTVRQLLYGLMLPSGCDAAYALADKFGVGKTRAARVKSFIGKMNSVAKYLGMKNTHFDSFDGISNGANYSTPRDLSKLAVNTLKNPSFRSIVATKSTTQKVTTKRGGYRNMAWTNTNKLLGSYKGAIGVKTGSGKQAKYCLVFAATRGKRTVVGAVLASSNEVNRTADAKKIMDYGFKL
ncbi:D-alanyl-D-alanine carboxypeptidase family protein [Streptomyces sp. NPDC051561]|uniref:D-alanyl-D-alanine carboxypeptidase family protein n=1 Tax=Streptomyces sp. NPDC051561 TaxID=3365658 RepID=UPI0037A1F507